MEFAESMKQKNIKCLIALPNSGVSKLAGLYSNYSRKSEELVLVTDSEKFKSTIENVSYDNVGIILSHPITRLVEAYRAFKTTEGFEQSFTEFYRDSKRVNYYSRVLKGIDLRSLGYVAITESFYKAVLLIEAWCGGEYYRIPYGELINYQNEFELDDEILDEINSLYSDDVTLYEEVKLLFDEMWQSYQKSVNIEVEETKRLYIHLGPPKTGTSALQLWLNQSVKQLNDISISYPEHGTDVNDVSSGNFNYVISVDSSGNRYFDDQKAQQTVNDFNLSKYGLLLLSSEHFFYYLPWFFSRLPSADYIFYIRHPLALAESGYHQEVKRHGRTCSFQLPIKLDFHQLKVVSLLAKEFDVNITYRYFGEATFEGGTLYSDFSKCMPYFIRPPVVSRKLNTQLSAGALELKRIANEVADEETLNQLDFFLQKISEDKPSFSLIPHSNVEQLKRDLEISAKAISLINPQLDIEKLRKLLYRFEPAPFCSEHEMKADLEKVVKLLRTDMPLLANALYKESKSGEKALWSEKLEPSKLSVILAKVKNLFDS